MQSEKCLCFRQLRLYVIRRQGNQYRPVSIRFHRDMDTNGMGMVSIPFSYQFFLPPGYSGGSFA